MLSQEEARNFIENGLRIQDFHSKLRRSPLETINYLIYQYHKCVPFQNLATLMQSAGTMDVPELDQVKEDVLTFRGGLCYTNNVFMKYLLDAVGLETFHVAGVCNPKHPNNHIATIICNLQKSGQKHLVDVGCGYPTYQAIELTESPGTYQSAYLTYCLKKVAPDEYVRLHSSSAKGQPSQKCYAISTSRRDLSHFQVAMLEVYRDRFPKKLRIMRFYEDKIIAFREAGTKVIKMKFEASTLTQTELESCDEIVTQISQVLPAYSKTKIELAIRNWQKNLLE